MRLATLQPALRQIDMKRRLLGGLLALTLLTVITTVVADTPIASSSFVGAEDPLSENGAWVALTSLAPGGSRFEKNNGAYPDRIMSGDDVGARTTAAVPADEYSEIVVGHIGNIASNVGPTVRVQTSGASIDSHYLWWASLANGGQNSLYRIDANGTSSVANTMTSTSPVVDGDRLRLIARGQVIYGIKNGVRDFIYNTGTNTTKYSSGATGILAHADTAVTNAEIASWSTGAAPTSSGTWASSTFAGTENPLDEGDRWYPLPGYVGFSKTGGQAAGLGSSHNAEGVWGIAPPATQYSEVTLGAVTSGGGGPIVRIDRTNAGQTGWLLFLYVGSPSASGIYKMTPDGNFSAVQTFTPTIVTGDKWRLTATGNTLEVFRNGVSQFTYTTDGSYPTGDVGIEAYTQAFTFTGWEGGDPAGGTGPTITSFTPTSGPAGTSVTISGTNFTGATAVTLNGVSAAFTVTSATTIQATVPAGATTGPLGVTTPSGTATSADSFTVGNPPTITSFTPTNGPVGTSVTINGTSFTGATAVTFNGVTAAFTLTSATAIQTTVPTGAATGPLTVTTPGGTATSASSFTVVSAPTITSFTPTSGPAGTSVTISGTNFTGATTVTFNGASAAFTVTSATAIQATVPTGATSGPLGVTTPNGTATSTNSFTVGSAPAITSFTPASGPAGTSVTISGTNFTGATTVTFNGASAAFTVTSATAIQATVPTGATSGPLSVTTPGGTATSTNSFTVGSAPGSAPAITSFTPASGPVGTSVTISGTNFTGATTVMFNGASAAFTVTSATAIQATVPTGATSGPLGVTTPGGTATSANSFAVVSGAGSPIASSSFVGAEDPLSENGAWVALTSLAPGGSRFEKNNGAFPDLLMDHEHAGARTTAAVPADEYSEIVVGHIGNTASNLGPIVRVQTSGASIDSHYLWWASLANGGQNNLYRIDANGTSYVANTLTTTSPIVDGDRLRLIARGQVIYGIKNGVRDFIYNTGTNTTKYSSGASGMLAHADTALTNAEVASWSTGPAPTSSGTWASSTFAGTENPLDEGDRWYSMPGYAGFSKTGGQAAGLGSSHNAEGVWGIAPPATQYSEVTLGAVTSGGGGPIVRIDRTNAGQTGWLLFLDAGSPSSSGIYKMTPDGNFSGVQTFTPTIVTGDKWRLTATGNTLEVFRNGVSQFTYTTDGSYPTGDVGIEAYTQAFTFTGWEGGDTAGGGTNPTITSFTPASGPLGTSVTISGTNFTGATAVTFNGVSAAFTVSSATAIQATLPTGATSGPIGVTTPNGTATSTNSFTVGSAPAITSFTPASGPVGTSVTISGTNFTGATAVTFNGVSAAFTVTSDTAIQATVPTGATSGPLSVTTPNGTATTANSFTVGSAPAITGFTPASGPVGTSVTISGTNFTGATAVTFNGVSASFTATSATAIQATVPTGATTGPLSVTTAGGTATSPSAFTVVYPPTITSFTPTTGPVGTSVTISGSNFTGATAVTFNGVSAAFTVTSDTAIQATVPTGATTGPLSVTTAGGTATGATFTIQQQQAVATPTFSPGGGTYTGSVTVTISDATSGATIYYTTDGSTPTTASPVYGGVLTLTQTTTLKAMAAASGMTNSSVASATYTIQQPVATPTFSPGGGTYTGSVTVTISDATSGATIYYTTDGSTPTTASPVYGGALTLTQTTTLKAMAAASEMTNSGVASAAYTIQQPVATPTFSPGGGTYTGSVTVTISDATSGATIYYTTDGSTPTTASPVYGGALTLTQTTTLKAMAAASGMTNSSVASATYTIQQPVATPTFSPGGGTYTGSVTVTISDATGGATIHYTTDGSTPTTASPVYGGALTLTQTTTLKAMAAASGMTNSSVASATYTIQQPVATPTFSPGGGTYSGSVTVTISDATNGATIYYTTDGSTPTTASPVYGGALTLTQTTTLKAMAAASGMTNSSVASATYTIQQRAATPTFSPDGGTYILNLTVSISDATPGATIYYTTDGSTPTTSSEVYRGPLLNLPLTTFTIKAIAVAPGWSESTVASATYTIVL